MDHWLEKVLGWAWIVVVAAAIFVIPDQHDPAAIAVASYLLVATFAYGASVKSLRGTGDLMKNAIITSLVLALVLAGGSEGRASERAFDLLLKISATTVAGVFLASVVRKYRHRVTESASVEAAIFDEISRRLSQHLTTWSIWERSAPAASRIVLTLSDGSHVSFAADGAPIQIAAGAPSDLAEQGFVCRFVDKVPENREARDLYFRLWTKATNDGEYNKAEWQELGL